MTRAMQRHENGEARVIPVILHPCDWQSLPFGRLSATPTDGKPVSKFPNQHDAFLQITKAIRQAAEELDAVPGGGGRVVAEGPGVVPSSNPVSESQRPNKQRDIRSGNLRIKKQFTDHERDQFLDEAFEYIANYFEGSLAELEERNPEVETRFRRVDANHFNAAVYISGTLANSCRIWMEGQRTFGGIAYSVGERGYGNSINESLSVDDDGYSLYLKPLGLAMYNRADKQLTHEGGAEFFWSMFIEPLQR
jgi:hypothetical protein